ncbi:MAG TPA: DinB family protein [Terriglobales bacterium]
MRAIFLLGFSIFLVAMPLNAQSATKQNAPPTKKPERSFIGEVPTSIAASVGETLQFVEGEFLGVAEAMPEEKYDFVPTIGKFDDARTFREQVKHVACVQFALFNEFEGKQPPPLCERGGPSSAKTKAELIQYLKESFDYGNGVMSQLTAANSLDRVDGRYAAPTTKLGISVASIWHVTDHYGQLVEYLRMNGIVPPLTQKYGVKVR